NFGSTSITNTNFTNNFAFAYTNDSYNGQVISQGGAVYGSNILIKNCSFINNSAIAEHGSEYAAFRQFMLVEEQLLCGIPL
ncbi:MAG: hypothetical protein ACRC1M_05315, partial [Methanobacteriaceae archaeon]